MGKHSNFRISLLSSWQWSHFFRHDTIFSVARSISDMCLSFIWIFQSISCRNMTLCHVDLYKHIYYCYAKQLDVLWQMFHVKYSSGYTYNWVHLWFLQFPNKLLYPIICMYFQFYPLCFYDVLHILISYWVHFFSYHILFHVIFLYLLHKLTPVYHTCMYTMMYHVCHLYKIYIFEIYTLA